MTEVVSECCNEDGNAEDNPQEDIQLAAVRVDKPQAVVANIVGVANPQRITRICTNLEHDFENNIYGLLRTRKFYRGVSSITETIANTFLYIGFGLSTTASATSLITSNTAAVNYILYTSSIMFALHVTFIGIAKCSVNEEAERENNLRRMAACMGYTAPNIKQEVQDSEAPITHHPLRLPLRTQKRDDKFMVQV